MIGETPLELGLVRRTQQQQWGLWTRERQDAMLKNERALGAEDKNDGHTLGWRRIYRRLLRGELAL